LKLDLTDFVSPRPNVILCAVRKMKYASTGELKCWCSHYVIIYFTWTFLPVVTGPYLYLLQNHIRNHASVFVQRENPGFSKNT